MRCGSPNIHPVVHWSIVIFIHCQCLGEYLHHAKLTCLSGFMTKRIFKKNSTLDRSLITIIISSRSINYSFFFLAENIIKTISL
jgi:hypothetical protein